MPRDFNDLPDELVVKAATEALTRPDSFMQTRRDDDLFVTWGITPIGQHRDSDALARSNYRCILADLKKKHRNNIGELSSSHWAVGWMDQITVRVLKKESAGIVPENITPAFRTVIGIAGYLAEEYPVYDESDFSELEWTENHEAFDSEWDTMVGRWDEDEGPEPTGDEKDAVFARLNDCETPDGYYCDHLAEEVKAIRADEGDE